MAGQNMLGSVPQFSIQRPCPGQVRREMRISKESRAQAPKQAHFMTHTDYECMVEMEKGDRGGATGQ